MKIILFNTLQQVASWVLFCLFRKRSELTARLLQISPKNFFFREANKDHSKLSRRKHLLATLFLYTNYQRPYLVHLADSIKALYDNVEVRSFDLREEPRKIKRLALMAQNHGIGFHAYPFRTETFPATMHHVYVMHGLDNGRYDKLGSFSFGAGRVLGKSRKRLYDFLLVSSPWSRELAHLVVPEYTGKVLVTGDWRADAILCASNSPARNRAIIRIPERVSVVGIVSSHGTSSTLRQFGHQLIDTITSCHKNTVFMIFFHPYERIEQPELFESLQRYCQDHKNVRIVSDNQFEASLAACDLLISDYGSTSIYFSLLGRPIVFLPFDESLMLANFPTMTLRQQVQTAPSLTDSIPFIEEVNGRGNNRLLCPPQWFIQQLYPDGSNFSALSKKALETIFSSI